MTTSKSKWEIVYERLNSSYVHTLFRIALKEKEKKRVYNEAQTTYGKDHKNKIERIQTKSTALESQKWT